MKRRIPALLICMLSWLPLRASEIVEVSILSDRILLLWFDDGSVDYPNDLNVSRLEVGRACSPVSYMLTSVDDANYLPGQMPVQIHRKSKGSEFVRDAGWAGESFDPRSKPWASEHFIYLVLPEALQPDKNYSLSTGELAGNGKQWDFSYDLEKSRSEAVHVNTIGYETAAPKFGYVYQWMGDGGGLDLSAYEGLPFHLYREGGAGAVFSGILKRRKPATNEETSQVGDSPDQNFLGAEVYECDFSPVSEDGTYTLVVEGFGSSYPFRIGKDALWEAYYTCGRSLYYQRSGIRLEAPYTDGDYVRPVNQNTRVTDAEGAAFEGQMLYSGYPYTSWAEGNSGFNQNTGEDSRPAIREAAIGKPIDVAGFYHDAGDWDGYSTHQRIPMLLMTTYEFASERFADMDLNIPESGNGIPDLVDEASWLIKYNYRLRKELMDKAYSDGGVGGARICPDVFNEIDGKDTEKNLPSWKDPRRYVVTQADAFMTYMYAGQAAQLAVILKGLGKDPLRFPVEMLDALSFADMSRDTVNWEKEAREAYAWASASENQPDGNNNYDHELWVYQSYAAVNLYRLTNDEAYHGDAKAGLEKLAGKSVVENDERFPVYTYLLTNNQGLDYSLWVDLKEKAISTARKKGLDAASQRACRWGGDLSMPMLVGQASTPAMFETIVAFGLTNDKVYSDAVHTTADYFLGTNPLHTTWASRLGPRPAEAGFHLDSRYNNDWVLYPGFVPYGPWSMRYDYTPYTWIIDGVKMEGGHGPWNKDWANFSQYPLMDQWPGHERWNSNIHAPMSSENTVHQNSVFVALTYGFVNNRKNSNATSEVQISRIELDRDELNFTAQGQVDTLWFSLDEDHGGFAQLKWESADPRVAHVDAMGRVTAVTAGSTSISCSTLDESVSASCKVSCSWEEVAVDSIGIRPDSMALWVGQTGEPEVFFYPAGVDNTQVEMSFSEEGIARINEYARVQALAPGMVYLVATSMNGGKKDSMFLEVLKSSDRLIADFDSVVPVTETVDPDLPQIYFPGGSGEVDADNPLLSSSNPSAKVFRWDRPDGDWKLFGIHMDTLDYPDLSAYSQLQFKYFGKDIRNFYFQVKGVDGEQYEMTLPVEGKECWQLFALDLDQDMHLKQFNVFVNSNFGSPAFSASFDDFMLAADPAQWYGDLVLDRSLLEMDSGENARVVAFHDGQALSWYSDKPEVAVVDQDGRVSALKKGTARIYAVPLYGEAVSCEVRVDGGDGKSLPADYEQLMILDFENYELDGISGYEARSWASDQWARAANPAKGSLNRSEKALTWYRDGRKYDGGFGVDFPEVSTWGWERLGLQVYGDRGIGKIRLEAGDAGSDPVQSAELEVDIQPRKWNQVLIPLVEFDSLHFSMGSLSFLPAAGTPDAMNVWVDNVWLERGGSVPLTGLSFDEPHVLFLEEGSSHVLRVLVEPENATYPQLVWSSSDPEVIAVDQSGVVTALAPRTAVVTARSKLYPHLEDSMDVEFIYSSLPEKGTGSGVFRAYPNPSSGMFMVAASKGIASLEVLSMAGELLHMEMGEGRTRIRMEHVFGEGIYLLRMHAEDGDYYFCKLTVL